MLAKAGFEMKPGKGSHQRWFHREKGLTITLPGQDGADAKPYLFKQVREIIAQAEGKR